MHPTDHTPLSHTPNALLSHSPRRCHSLLSHTTIFSALELGQRDFLPPAGRQGKHSRLGHHQWFDRERERDDSKRDAVKNSVQHGRRRRENAKGEPRPFGSQKPILAPPLLLQDSRHCELQYIASLYVQHSCVSSPRGSFSSCRQLWRDILGFRDSDAVVGELSSPDPKVFGELASSESSASITRYIPSLGCTADVCAQHCKLLLAACLVARATAAVHQVTRSLLCCCCCHLFCALCARLFEFCVDEGSRFFS